MTINRSITASVTIDSNTLTNVSSFTGIQISEGLKAIGYIDYRCNVGSWNSGAGTITMETSYPYGPTYCGLQTADGVSIDVIKSCNNSYDKITNKTIELNTTGWTATADATLAQDTGRQVYGLKITAAGSSVGAYQDSSAAAAQVYQVFFDYKNAAGAVAQYAVYDNTNAAWITTATDLDDSTDWTIRKRITFTAPAGCTSARLYLLAKANENVVWFDTISWFEYPHPYPYETVTLQDGTCLWQCTMGKGPVTADYNYVAEGPDLSYIAKTGFTGAKGETHGVSGGNPYFTSYENANFVLTANSTILINAGVDLSTSFTNDILGNARSGAWDIGPYEYGGLPIAPCPVGSTCAMWLR
jgi:hypothetical protein